MLDPKGRVIMISGTSRGIGLALAQVLAAKGYSLSLGLRDPAAMAEIASRENATVTKHAYDALDPEAPARWLEATLAAHGRIDGLVNNAGIYRGVSLLEPDETALDELWQVNVKGPLRMIRAVWPHLVAAGSGRVVNLASLSGKRVAGPGVGYSMSKFAVVAMTQQVRRDGWQDGIRAAAICPSFVRSDMSTSIAQKVPGEEMTQPEDLAELVASLIALPNSASVPELTVNWNYETIY